MPDAEPLYNLKAVVQQTGIPAQSLRAWEKRYGILTPVRKPNGHRVYPRSEVEKLLRLKALMARGMTISQAAAQLEHAPAPAPEVPGGEVDRIRAALGGALAACDAEAASRLFGLAAELLTVSQVVLRVVRPLLPDLTPFGRTYLRTRLGALLLQAAPLPGAQSVLVTAPEYEDLRPLLVALLLSRKGKRVIYVEGDSAPAGLQPDVVIDPRRWRDGVPPEQFLE
ncbi:MAG TPA: MerR family transcriptional regulator [Symbiobacteriaceae bacterium]|nr:MerR family transcriptional regulator [Symbiobacteriaceae bacterium]